MPSISALKVKVNSGRETASHKDIQSGDAPPLEFLRRVPKELDGTCLLVDVRLYKTSLGLFTALADIGAQVPVIRRSCVSDAAWSLRVAIDRKIDCFGSAPVATTCIVPVSVAVGQNRGDGVWCWALPMDRLPHEGVDLVLDYTTVTLLFDKFDFSDQRQVKMQVMGQFTMHLEPAMRINIQFADLLRNAASVLTVLLKAVATPTGKTRTVPQVARLSRVKTGPDDSVTNGALNTLPPCEVCAKNGLGPDDVFWPLKNGECPFESDEWGPAFYLRLHALFQAGQGHSRSGRALPTAV